MYPRRKSKQRNYASRRLRTQISRQAEIYDSEVVVVTAFAEDNVEGFEIEMDEALGVDILDSSADLPHDRATLGLC